MSTESNFNSDVRQANKDEQFVTELFNLNDIDRVYTWVGKDKNYYNDGDIRITDGDNVLMADVKSDSRCWETGNILAEHRVLWREKGWVDGFMLKSNYDLVLYLSKADKKIYVIDFKKWQKKYLNQSKKRLFIPHNDKYGQWLQSTDGYLMSIQFAKKNNIIVEELQYTEEMNINTVWAADKCPLEI